jgi:MtN3 and saliva related transmembrane protein
MSILRIRTLILVDGALQPCPRACGQSSMGDALGYLAGLCTTAANVPQVLTTFRRKSGDGLSFRMLAVLGLGLALWVGYGVASHSWPLIVFNAIAFALVISLVMMKLRYDRKPMQD